MCILQRFFKFERSIGLNALLAGVNMHGLNRGKFF